MKVRFRLGVTLLLMVLGATSCSQLSGKPGPNSEVPRPDQILDSKLLFARNCAGCHGAEGKEGAALDLSNPVYLALVDDDTLRATISHGRSGTAMSAFAREAGGMLTDQQVQAIVTGIRAEWGRQDILAGTQAPPYV